MMCLIPRLRFGAYKADCKRRSDDALRGLLVALLHQAENGRPTKPE
jgi:hypothetical protein